MTPNTARRQYYCAAARSSADHGRMSVTEKALLAVLPPEADAYARAIRLEAPSWEEVAAMNKHLKRIWTKFQLDPLMVPTAVWA
jgi:hypothetical protein